MGTREELISENKESSEDQTQQTQLQTDSVTNEELRLQINELNQRLLQQQSTIHNQYRELSEKIPERVPVQRDVAKDRENFFADPIGLLDERDNKLLDRFQKVMAPVFEVVGTFRNDNEYTRLKKVVMGDPYFAKALNDQTISNMVDQIMAQPNTVVNENSLKAAIISVVGARAMGLVTESTPNNKVNDNNNQPKGEKVTAPYVPSNNMRTKEPSTKKERPPLDENARFIMRTNRMTEDEYWEYMDMQADQVLTHKREEKK